MSAVLRNITLVALLFIIASCAREPDNAIRFGLSSMPTNLNPLFATDAASSRINRLIFQRLVDFNDSKQPVPALANWQRITPRLYRFTLTENNSLFHNGSTLDATDVKATYEFVLNKENASPHRAALAVIEKIETPDPRTIDFHLNRTDPLFPGYLVIGIVPSELLTAKHPFERHPIGSGAARFISWPEDGRLMIQRQQDKQLIEFLHVPNPTVRVLKIMRGEIDLIQNDLPPELVNYLGEQSNLVTQKARGSNFAYLGFNLQDPVLKDLRVRKAFALAINRDEIIQYVFGNSARKATSLLPPDHWAGNPTLETLPYSPDTAKKILAELGYSPQNPLPLTYKTSNDPFRVRLATIMQSQLSQVGIDMDIRSYDWGTFYGDIKSGRFQLYSLAWIGIKTPDIFRYVFHSSAVPPSGANRGHFVNASMDKSIELAESRPSVEEQAQYYRDVQRIALEELPYVPLWYENHVSISRTAVSNYQLGWDGNYDGLLTIVKK